MKKKLRVLLLWILISLILQFSTYAILNHMVAKVIAPPKEASSGPITTQLKAKIPGVNLENVQVSL